MIIFELVTASALRDPFLSLNRWLRSFLSGFLIIADLGNFTVYIIIHEVFLVELDLVILLMWPLN